MKLAIVMDRNGVLPRFVVMGSKGIKPREAQVRSLELKPFGPGLLLKKIDHLASGFERQTSEVILSEPGVLVE
jgi:hypothetical protein